MMIPRVNLIHSFHLNRKIIPSDGVAFSKAWFVNEAQEGAYTLPASLKRNTRHNAYEHIIRQSQTHLRPENHVKMAGRLNMLVQFQTNEIAGAGYHVMKVAVNLKVPGGGSFVVKVLVDEGTCVNKGMEIIAPSFGTYEEWTIKIPFIQGFFTIISELRQQKLMKISPG